MLAIKRKVKLDKNKIIKKSAFDQFSVSTNSLGDREIGAKLRILRNKLNNIVTLEEISKLKSEIKIINENVDNKKEIIKREEQKLNELNISKSEKVSILEERSIVFGTKFKKFFGIKDKILIKTQSEIDKIDANIKNVNDKISKLNSELELYKQINSELYKQQKILESDYERMKTTPLTNEEKRGLLHPEILAKLSTKEYIKLWRKLNPYFLAHVTRQGFRDHNSMIYHSAFMHEFCNGFIDILQGGRKIQPPIAVRGLRSIDKASVRAYLENNIERIKVLEAKSKIEAFDRLRKLLHFSFASAPKYPDMTAVHFAAQKVLDSYYGGEKNNEIFFVYPSDVLTSQHYYSTGSTGVDVLVFPRTLDNPGIPVDAGIVFIPNKTLVDPETGSKYASKVKKYRWGRKTCDG